MCTPFVRASRSPKRPLSLRAPQAPAPCTLHGSPFPPHSTKTPRLDLARLFPPPPSANRLGARGILHMVKGRDEADSFPPPAAFPPPTATASRCAARTDIGRYCFAPQKKERKKNRNAVQLEASRVACCSSLALRRTHKSARSSSHPLAENRKKETLERIETRRASSKPSRLLPPPRTDTRIQVHKFARSSRDPPSGRKERGRPSRESKCGSSRRGKTLDKCSTEIIERMKSIKAVEKSTKRKKNPRGENRE
jgi:hypothetical protein